MSQSVTFDALLAAATEKWPAGWVPRASFEEYIQERTAPGEPLPIEAAAPLYLACACVRGVLPALKAFESHYLPDIRRAAARTGLDADHIVELSQVLREELLVGRNGGTPALGEFSGRGDLRGWLRVTATRAALRMKQRVRRSDDRELDRLQARATDSDPELAYMKAFYRDAFRAAFRAGAVTLEPRERTVLHQHTVEGLTVDELGAAHGVHRATAARWVQTAREKLVGAVRQEFVQRVKVSPRELASVLRLVESRLEVTMKRLLGPAS